MEIERKFLVHKLPPNLDAYSTKNITQGYISTNPVIRIRHSNHEYYLTCKGKGLLAREEFELSINEQQFSHLSKKLDFPLIHKTRYNIPYNHHMIELDIFKDSLKGLILAEVEFDSIEAANNFTPPNWFATDVTSYSNYQNSNLCQLKSYDPNMSI